MKNKLLRLVLMLSKFTLYGIVAQCFFISMLIANDGAAQENVSVTEVNLSGFNRAATIIELFDEIETQSNFKFFYDKRYIDNKKEIQITKSRVTVADVLFEISKNTELKFKQINSTINVSLKEGHKREQLVEIIQQAKTVTGVITSGEDGSTLPGVNVVIKGTSRGTVTDIDGNYKIDVPSEESILQFSSVGFVSEEIAVGDKSVINLEMVPDVQALEEIVVVGYGEMKRSDLSTAQVSIGSDDIEKTVNTTIEQAIQGRAAGVYITQNTGQPGGGISVNIRGISSINGSNQPLYVIDGVQIQQDEQVSYGATSSSNPLSNLNPSDIENIEILQGPSATAIYGSRATNGVVLITTKRGKTGETQVNYNYMYNLQDKPKQLPVMNLPQYAQLINELRALQGQEPRTEFGDLSLLGPGTNWQDELFRQAALQKHQISLSGGSESTRFYLSGEHFDQEGIALGSGFTRNSVRLNLDNDVRDWIKISANLSYSQTEQQLATTQQNVINDALRLAPNIPVQNPDGSWGGADESNASSVQFTPFNPVAIANLLENDLNRKQFLGGVNLKLDIYKGLVFETGFNSNIENSRQENFTPTYRIGSRTNDEASLYVQNGNSFYWNWSQILRYSNSIGNHNFDVMASHESQESSWENVSGQKFGFVTNEIPDLNIGDAQGAVAGGGQGDWAIESYFGRVNYNFSEKYYVQAAIRTDGSVRFGPERKWGTFPSASVAWRISEEVFMQGFDFLDEFKIRFETGITGSQGNTSYFGPLYSSATPWGTGFRQGRYSNPELQWEETLTNNLGFNLSVLNNRVQLEGDFYIKNTDNLILTAPLPLYLGTDREGSVNAPPINVGALENKGLAFSLQTINIDRGDFTWKTMANFSMFRTELTEIYSGADFISPRTPWYIGNTGSGNNWEQRSAVGKAPWLFRGYLYDGLFESVEDIENSAVPGDNNGERLPASPDNVWVGDIKFKDLNDDGIINEQDKTNIGNPWPKSTFGITNSVSYKGFDLSVLITGVYGNDVYNILRFDNTNPNNVNLGRNLLQETFQYAKIEGEGEEAVLANPGTDIPRLSTNSTNGNRLRFTDQFVEDGTYVRLKNVQLTYNLPQGILGGQNVVRGARITIGAQNLYTFTNYSGYDPEVGAYVGRDASNENAPIGVDYGRYPITPTYTLSVGVDF